MSVHHSPVSVLAALSVVALATLACKQDGPEPCPQRYSALKSPQADNTCACPSEAAKGSVWGTDIYTTDSSICAAATHAGAVTPGKGGTVQLKSAAGCSSYVGSSRNGVQSGSWGSYQASFFFPGHGTPQCATAAAKAAPTGDKCPTSFGANTDLECTCDASMTGAGSVWGSSLYTTDSSVCRAALHAGEISASGGKVRAKRTDGCGKYVGSNANGVKTSNWGSFQKSFYFPSKGKPSCP